jgi:hypothetical protein
MKMRVAEVRQARTASNPHPREDGYIDPDLYALQDKEIFYSMIVQSVMADTFLGGLSVREHVLAMYRPDLEALHEKNASRPAIAYMKEVKREVIGYYRYEIEKLDERIRKCEDDARQKGSGGYTCKECGKNYKGKGGLTNHLIHEHPEAYVKIIEEIVEAEYKLISRRASRAELSTFEDGKKDRIAQRKIHMFLMRDEFDEALIQVTRILDGMMSHTKKPSRKEFRAGLLNVLICFGLDVKKRFKNEPIPFEIKNKIAGIKELYLQKIKAMSDDSFFSMKKYLQDLESRD